MSSRFLSLLFALCGLLASSQAQTFAIDANGNPVAVNGAATTATDDTCTAEYIVTQAIALLWADGGYNVTGTIMFDQANGESSVRVTGMIMGLVPGTHGFHIHEFGNIGESCEGAGEHFNPDGVDHGSPADQMRHKGDLGNINADAYGVASVNTMDDRISLNGNYVNVIGRAVVVHADPDDLGVGGQSDSLTTGHAGSRVACGVIGIATQIDNSNYNNANNVMYTGK